jgi:hypothetical protein
MGKRSDYKNLIETIFSFVFLDNSEKATLYIFPERLRLQYEYRAYDYVLSLQYTTRKRTYTFRNLPCTRTADDSHVFAQKPDAVVCSTNGHTEFIYYYYYFCHRDRIPEIIIYGISRLAGAIYRRRIILYHVLCRYDITCDFPVSVLQ